MPKWKKWNARNTNKTQMTQKNNPLKNDIQKSVDNPYQMMYGRLKFKKKDSMIVNWLRDFVSALTPPTAIS